MQTAISVVEMEGSPQEMGATRGERDRAVLRDIVDRTFRNFHEIVKRKSLTYLSWERNLALAARYLPYAQEYAPDLVDELRAYAEAALVDFITVFAHNCFLDFDDLAYPFLADQLLFGCTTLAATPLATGDGTCFVGQNYDFRSVFKGTCSLLHLKPERGPEAYVWTMGGLLGCAGINSAGISLVINNLIPSDSRPGVPHAFIVRKILQQERLSDAIAAVVGAHRATGAHYVLGDASGQVVALETTATNYEAIHPVGGYLAHANHYATIPLRPYERYRLPYSTDSIVRAGRMEALLQQKAGRIRLEDLQGVLSDHANYPYSICRHEADGVEQDMLGKTVGSFLMDQGERKLYVANGNPCEEPYQVFHF